MPNDYNPNDYAPKRQEVTFRQVITGLGALLVVFIPASVVFGHYNTTSDQAALIPAIQIAIQAVQNDANSNKSDIQMLKDRRIEDAGTMREIKTEIMSKLDIMDRKMDEKADRTSAGVNRFQR